MRLTPPFTAALRGAHLLVLAACLCGLAAFAARADAAWREPVGGANPINHRADRTAFYPSLAAVGGVPHVAWTEWDDADNVLEVRVSRLNAAGTAWEELVGGSSPIAHGSGLHGQDPSLADVGGVPYVAWKEGTSHGHDQIRVSRLNAAGTAWEDVGSGPSPINVSQNAWDPSLAAVDGVPYVARTEWKVGSNNQTVINVSRLNAAGTGWDEVGGPVSDPDANSYYSSIAAVDGVPHVAWIQLDGTNAEVRVARLNAAGTGWDEVVSGPSPINHDSTKHADSPSLTSVDGVPHVAWTERDAALAYRLRVSRLNAAGTAWEEVVGGDNPFDQPDGHDAANPSLTAVDGEPYVAWLDARSSDIPQEVRVARLNAEGTAWKEVVGGSDPISHARDAQLPSLAAVGGVPYVAWFDGADGTDGDGYEVRVSRLEPEFLSQAELATTTGAFLFSKVRTYGVAYPIAFEYGRGTALDKRTAATQTAYDAHEDVVIRKVDGLDPGTDYSWRTIGFDGFAPTAVASTRTFTTLEVPAPVPDPLLIAALSPRLKGIAGRSVVVRYALSRDAEVTIEVRRCGGRLAAMVDGGSAEAGLNKVKWDGRIRGLRPKPGCYALTLRAASSDGQVASDDVKLTLRRRAVRRR